MRKPFDALVEGLISKNSRGGWDLNSVPKMVHLLRLAEGSDPSQVTAASHSENWYELSGRQNGPVKGMAFREARAVPE